MAAAEPSLWHSHSSGRPGGVCGRRGRTSSRARRCPTVAAGSPQTRRSALPSRGACPGCMVVASQGNAPLPFGSDGEWPPRSWLVPAKLKASRGANKLPSPGTCCPQEWDPVSCQKKPNHHREPPRVPSSPLSTPAASLRRWPSCPSTSPHAPPCCCPFSGQPRPRSHARLSHGQLWEGYFWRVSP